MDLDVIIEDSRWNRLEPLVRRVIPAALTHLSHDAAHEVAVMGCDDGRIAELNQDFRGKPQPTNVLSWPHADLAAKDDGGAPHPPGQELGDIAIAYETCLKEAAEQNKPFDDHVSHLLVHGLLHLLGYDHEREQDAARMEKIETEILGNLGIPDPYTIEHASTAK